MAVIEEFHPDGRLMPLRQSRAETVERMAADLVALNAFADEHDARLVLRVKGYAAFDIEALLPDAMHAAAQTVIAREMGEP